MPQPRPARPPHLVVAGALGVGGLLVGLLHRREDTRGGRLRVALAALLGVAGGVALWCASVVVWMMPDWEGGTTSRRCWL